MSVWDKLWEGGPTNAITYVDPVGSQNAISSIAWLKLVKAEGDRLQKKAKKWDKYSTAFMTSDFTVVPFETVEKLVKKLEVIRNIVERYSNEPIYTRDIVSFTNTMAEIKAVLEK